MAESGDFNDLLDAVQMMQLGGLGAMRPGQEVDENNLEGPTRALWIGSIPVSTTVTSLDAIFSLYGKIESTRVLTHKNCGFVNFERVESAIQAKNLLNGKEIFPGAGPVRIGYAKVPTTPTSETPGPSGGQSSPRADSSTRAAGGDEGRAGGEKENDNAVPHVPPLSELQNELSHIVKEFGASESDCHNIALSIQRAVTYSVFMNEIPPVPEPSQTRAYDAPRLRDIRKRIDNGACTVQEIEETALDMLPEIAELSSDYLGNTVVQKLFEYCSDEVKEKMLVPICPHLAEIGVHKNGTWAGQKIIDVAKTPTQKQMIVENLRPYSVPLFLDQYGNYVLQCCLRFGSPFNDFIFESMLSQMWEISQGRFGARAMRACLESHHSTKDQQRMLAAAIALHSVQLATNANGALLLTWYLDTCTFPHRRTVLAPRLVPHLVHLCTHKVAYLTVLKIVNQRNEPEAREIILKALFFSPGDETLENILKDPQSGATLIFKVLTTPFFEETMRAEVVKTVAKILTKLKTTPNQGYKRLMDEVGLSSRSVQSRDPHHGREHAQPGAAEKHQQRPASRQINHNVSNNNGFPPQPPPDRQFPPQFAPTPAHDSPLNMSRTASSEHGLPPYNAYGLPPGLPGFGPLNPPGFGQDPMGQMNQQQLQYQAFLASQTRTLPPAGFYHPGVPQNGFPSLDPSAASVDAFRAMQAQSGGPQAQMNASPMVQPSPFPQFNPAMNVGQLYGYPQQFYAPQQPQGPAPSGRRGRVSFCPPSWNLSTLS
jgi:protein JSN1